MIIRTQIGTRDSARQLRSEPSGAVTATNVQGAIDQMDARITDVEQSGAITEIVDAGDVDVSDEFGIYLINKAVGEPTNAVLRPAATFNHPVQIKDTKLDAAANNITITPDAADVNGIDGLASVTINTNGGGFTLIPRELGWSIGANP